MNSRLVSGGLARCSYIYLEDETALAEAAAPLLNGYQGADDENVSAPRIS